MSHSSGRASTAKVSSSLAIFVRNVAAYSGARGARALVYVFLGALVEGVGLLLIVPFLALVFTSHGANGFLERVTTSLFAVFAVEGRVSRLLLLIGFLIALMIVRAIVINLRDVTMARLGLGFVQRTRSRLAHAVGSADWAAVSKMRHSRVTFLLGAGMRELNGTILSLFRDVVAVVMLVSQIAIALYLSPLLTAFALGAIALAAVALLPYLERARRFGDFIIKVDRSLLDDVGQFLGALKLAKSQNIEDRFTRKFDASLADLTAQRIQYVRRQTLTRLAVTTIATMVGAIALVVGVAVLNVPAVVLVTLLVIFSRLNGPVAQLYGDFSQIAQALPLYEDVCVLEAELGGRSIAMPSSESVVFPRGRIEFHDVNFAHDGESSERFGAGVHALDLTLESGSVVGVTGPSGAGKTTFADLLVGLYPPQSGRILVDGVSLKGAAVPAWRDRIAYVAQDPFLFHDTIRSNLLWANPCLDETALWNALKVAGAAEFVRQSANGLNTVVGERGSLVSGGERQRLALARAILRNPRLLVLDEASNAIDLESEQAILARLVALEPRPTIIIIAHRPQSLSVCGRILVFEKGRVSESAAHSAADQHDPGREVAPLSKVTSS